MSEIRCPWCDKPSATEEDWERYGGGEGTHLCWADPRCEMDGDEDVVRSLRAALAAAQQCNAEARERIALDNAVCLCGCPAGDHDDLGEDGEQCEHEDHECLRVAPAVLAAMQRLRASSVALREALRHAARELQYVLDADPCEQAEVHQSGEALACIVLAESLLGPMRDWPEEPNASMSATLAAKREDR